MKDVFSPEFTDNYLVCPKCEIVAKKDCPELTIMMWDFFECECIVDGQAVGCKVKDAVNLTDWIRIKKLEKIMNENN